MSLYIGLLGMFLILLAFILDEFFKTWRQDSMKYNILNLIGSLCLVYYAYTLKSLPFLILNSVWFLTSGYKLVVLMKKKF